MQSHANHPKFIAVQEEVRTMYISSSKGKKVKLKPLSKGSKESGSSETTLSFEQQKTLQDLREYFSTEVQLKVAANGKGKIEIPFGSEQDLKIILSMLSID